MRNRHYNAAANRRFELIMSGLIGLSLILAAFSVA